MNRFLYVYSYQHHDGLKVWGYIGKLNEMEICPNTQKEAFELHS
jgi:hypothetical protein